MELLGKKHRQGQAGLLNLTLAWSRRLTASVCASASGRGSRPAFGVLVCAFNLTGAKALGLMIAPEVLYQAHRLIC